MKLTELKPLLRRYLPLYRELGRWRAHRRFRARHGHLTTRDVFAVHYQQRYWGGQSASGRGSELASTVTVRARLPHLLEELGVQTLIDAPCGDFHWMQHVDLGERTYIGIDIVPAIIEQNQHRYGDKRRSFRVADLCRDNLPAADLLLCRDCLIHLPLADGLAAIRNMQRAGITYLLASTHPRTRRNIDIVAGDFRPVNLELPPFNFPPPMERIEDADGEGGGAHADKSLGLWRLRDLPLD